MRRILAICTSHIGGVLLITPAIDLLSRHFPGVEISVLVRKGTEAVLQNNPSIKHIYTDGEITSNQRMNVRTKSSLGKRLSQIPGGVRLIRQLRREHFDLAIAFNGGDRAALLAFFSGARERVGYKPNGGFLGKKFLFTRLFDEPAGPLHRVAVTAHLASQFLVSCGKSSIPLTAGPLVLCPTDQNLAWAEAEWQKTPAAGRPRVLLHPTSRVAFKCWSPAKWITVVERLQQTFDARVMITCGPDPRELKMAEVILNGCTKRPASRLGDMTLGQLAALTRRADIFLGVDSAPMHMAAGVGTPVVAVFGPSSDSDWAPWGEKHRVVRRPCPCQQNEKVTCSSDQEMECLKAVSADDVCRAASEVLLTQPVKSWQIP